MLILIPTVTLMRRVPTPARPANLLVQNRNANPNLNPNANLDPNRNPNAQSPHPGATSQPFSGITYIALPVV